MTIPEELQELWSNVAMKCIETITNVFSLASSEQLYDFYNDHKQDYFVPSLTEAGVPEEHHDTVAIMAAVLSLFVVYGLVSAAFSGKKKKKTLPPMGPSFDAYVESWKKGVTAYWILDNFRAIQQESVDRCCGVFELQTSYLTRLFLNGMKAGRIFICRDGPTSRKVLEESLKWKQGSQVLRDLGGYGENVLSESDNGPRWNHVRKSVNPAFSTANLQWIIDNDISQVVDEWIETKLSQTNGEPLDIHAEMKMITAKVILKAGFGYDTPDDEAAMVFKHMETCSWEYGPRSLDNPMRNWSLTRWMYKGIQDAKKSNEYLRTFCHKVLAEHNVEQNMNGDKPSDQNKIKTVLDFIVKDTDYANDDERISDMIMYMGAGFDTTANTLAFALLELAKTPKEQAVLRGALMESDEPRACPELKSAIRETLRLHTAAANGSVRIVQKDIPVTGSPYVIPKGSIVNVALYSVLHNGEVYQDPDTFKPRRWQKPSDAMMKTFMPFSLGMRQCQGQALAYAEMEIVLSKLLVKFEFDVVEEGIASCPITHYPVGMTLSAKRVNSGPSVQIRDFGFLEKGKKKEDDEYVFDILEPILYMLKAKGE